MVWGGNVHPAKRELKPSFTREEASQFSQVAAIVLTPLPSLQQGGEEPPAGRTGLRPKRNAARPASSTHCPPAAKKLKPLTEKRLHELELKEFQRQAQDLTDLQELLQELRQKGAAMSPEDEIVTLVTSYLASAS